MSNEDPTPKERLAAAIEAMTAAIQTTNALLVRLANPVMRTPPGVSANRKWLAGGWYRIDGTVYGPYQIKPEDGDGEGEHQTGDLRPPASG